MGISYINSLKIKSKSKSQLSLSLNGTNSTAPAPASTHHHKEHRRITNQDLAKNLENINTPANEKLDNTHKQLGEIDDLKKETLEERLFHRFPKKPIGITGAAIINVRKGIVAEQSKNFEIKSIKDLTRAVSQGNLQKTRTVIVDGMTFKLRKIGSNYFYGAIVNKGGIGAYLKGDYVLVVTHNNFIGFSDFTYFFGQVQRGLEDHKDEEKFEFFKNNFEKKRDELDK